VWLDPSMTSFPKSDWIYSIPVGVRVDDVEHVMAGSALDGVGGLGIDRVVAIPTVQHIRDGIEDIVMADQHVVAVTAVDCVAARASKEIVKRVAGSRVCAVVGKGE